MKNPCEIGLPKSNWITIHTYQSTQITTGNQLKTQDRQFQETWIQHWGEGTRTWEAEVDVGLGFSILEILRSIEKEESFLRDESNEWPKRKLSLRRGVNVVKTTVERQEEGIKFRMGGEMVCCICSFVILGAALHATCAWKCSRWTKFQIIDTRKGSSKPFFYEFSGRIGETYWVPTQTRRRQMCSSISNASEHKCITY